MDGDLLHDYNGFLCERRACRERGNFRRTGIACLWGVPEPIILRFGPKPVNRGSLSQPDKMPEAPVAMVIFGWDNYHPEPQWTAKAIDCGRATIGALF